MKQPKTRIHFTDKYLLQPTNPVTINLIGCGGTGSQMLTALARINQSLIALKHAGIFVRIFDDDKVSKSNIGRQLFASAEIGFPKAEVLASRINRFFGTNWKGYAVQFNKKIFEGLSECSANITITCVDNLKSRFEVSKMLEKGAKNNQYRRDKICYWMDFGNSRNTGQVILATIGKVEQQKSKKFSPVNNLPVPTEEFKDLFEAVSDDNTPSCSLSEALTKQDLFINSSLANMGASLLWNLFREGMIQYRGFFMNLKDFRTTPIPV
jgi:PRTRC genetic system ThiF family protein